MSLSLAGCSDYLDVTDKSSVSPDNFPRSVEQAELLLTSAYACSHQQGLYAFYWFPMGMYLYDKTVDNYDYYDDRATQLLNDTSPSCTYTTWTYAGIMQWIAYSNEAIEGIDNYIASGAPESELAQLDYMKGQALFNRALAYWHAQIFFELESKADGLGFPIIDKVLGNIDEMMPERASVADTWQFVIDTLKEAAELMSGNNSDKTRATEWAAKGLLAKVYMQARRSSEAIPVLEDIFANSGASLLPYDQYKDAFYADEKYEFNKETLYEIDMTCNEKQNGPWAGYTSGSAMPMVYGPWPMNLDFPFKKAPESGKEISTSYIGAWGNCYVADGNMTRFGFPLGKLPIRVVNPDFSGTRSVDNLPWMQDPEYTRQSQEVRDNKVADPRLFVSCAQPYFDKISKDARNRETFYDVSPEVSTRGLQGQHYFWAVKKFTNRDGTEGDLNYSSPANIPVIRLADLYLLYAEAISSSNPTLALEYVNKVHRRAYDCDPSTPSQYDYTSLNARTKAPESDTNLANSPLRYERWAELFAEGQWWYDVRRWEILPGEMAHYKQTMAGALDYLGERCYTQPIPLTEIERYNGTMKQSYNY